MQDNDFDNHIKSALEEYEDTTPVALGWERFQAMQAPAGQVVGIRRWLKWSVILNLLLVGAVAWLWWSFVDLKERMGQLESSAPADQQLVGDAGATANPAESLASKANMDTSSGERSGQSAVPVAARGDLTAGSAKGLFVTRATAALPDKSSPAAVLFAFNYRPRAAEWQIESETPTSLYPPFSFIAKEITRSSVAANERKSTKATMPLSTAIALEKSKMGNKVLWEYGISANSGYASFAENLGGSNAGGGVLVEAIFHPLLGFETGLAFQQYNFKTEDQTVALRQWERSTGLASPDPIEELSVRVQSLEMPLTLKLRLPKSDRNYWFGSMGVLQSVKLSKYQKYKVLKLEIEEGELEYEDVEVDFRDTGASLLYTGLMAELGFSKRLLYRPAQWQAGLYYKNSLFGSSQDAEKVKSFGVKAGLRF